MRVSFELIETLSRAFRSRCLDMKTTWTAGLFARTRASSDAARWLRLGITCVLAATLGACSGEVSGSDNLAVPGVTGGTSGAGSGPTGGRSGAPGSGGAQNPPLGGAGAMSACVAPQSACGVGCVNLQSDPANCGGCGRVCTAGQSCVTGTCRTPGESCGNGLTACNGSCVDFQTDEANCGSCGQPCSGGRECNAGQCACPSASMLCGTSCVDPQTNAQNCGGCGQGCDAGEACQGGQCVCGAGQQACGDECVNVQSDAEHCGMCNRACPSGTQCVAGSCACPSGQMACGDACADLQTSQQHCGACGTSCALGQTCMAGVCTASNGGAPLEDGCQGLAQGVTLREVAVYQTVKIPVMENGMAVVGDERNADVVAGRPALFRLFVNVASGFGARSLSARLFLDNGGTVSTYLSDDKPTISGSSEEEELDTTFQIDVPKEAITPQTRYSVEVVECGGTASGGMQSPRFPSSEGAELGAVESGVLKVHFVPVRVNNLLPETADSALAPYKELLLATYPVTDVQFTVGETLEAGSLNWTGILDSVRSRRTSDRPAADVYYYGLVRPNATLREYCQRACTTGIGFVPQGSSNQMANQRVAVGIGFSDRVSAETMAHELGHNHGRLHTDCGGPDQPDSNYPYDDGEVGVYGYDSRMQAIYPPNRTDIMGYCDNKWFSDYTYQGLLQRVRSVASLSSVVLADPDALSRFLVLLVDADGPRWGHPIDEPSLPSGEPEEAEALNDLGQPIASVTVYRSPIADIDAASIEVPLPEAGWHAIRVAGAPALEF